jgi:FkbM family methyltransferase
MNDISRLKARFRAGEISKPDFIREALGLHRALFDYVDIVGSTDIHEIRIAADGVSFTIGDERVRLHCPPDEARVAPLEVMNFDRYEPEETAVMDLLTAGARTILDIGANIGWYAARFAKRLPEARIFAFEPMPTSYAYLQRNVAANGVAERVMTFNYGLSSSSGPVEFFIAPASGTNASLKNVAKVEDAVAVTGVTLTLDQWVANYRVVPDFIKCDVEGAEFLVFQGGASTLREHRPVVFAELLRKWAKPFGYHPNDMLRYFDEMGYRCFAVGATGAREIAEVTDETIETNYAFLHGQAHAGLIATFGAVR